MQLRATAILLSARSHGETAVIARLMTEESGMVAAYIAGGRGRNLRPVVIPGNRVEMDLRSKSETQLPFAKLELVQSCGPWLSERLAAAAIDWTTTLTASSLPERNPYPQLYHAVGALLDAICKAPSARGWIEVMIAYEVLLLREMGYGAGGLLEQVSLGSGNSSEGERRQVAEGNGGKGGNGGNTRSTQRPVIEGIDDAIAYFDRLSRPIERYLLAESYGDAMAARVRLRGLLAKIIE